MVRNSLLPIEFQIKTFKIAAELGMDLTEAKKQRIMQLNELDEIQKYSLQQTTPIQQKRERWHDKFIKKNLFKVGDWDFLFDSEYKYFKENLPITGLGL
jgi:hypothetical protein